MRKFILLLSLSIAIQVNIKAQDCIDTVSNALSIITKSSFGGPDCLFTVRFCLKKTTEDAVKIDYAVTHTYGTMYRTINVAALPVGSVICEHFTFVADCNSTASFLAVGKKANEIVCGQVSDFIILPIRLSAFEGSLDRSGMVTLNWNTATEINSSHFVIQQSVDGRTFTEVGRVKAQGDSRTEIRYRAEVKFNDRARTNYFRLRMIDRDNSSAYSPLISIAKSGGRLVISPNPASSFLTASSGSLENLEIFNISGVKQNVNRIDANQIDIADLIPGVYFARSSYEVVRFIKE